MEHLPQYIVNGILVGGTLALMSVGLGLIFGVMRVINFAQADFMMLAMYFPALFLFETLGVDPLLSALLAMPLFFALGYAIHRTLLDRVTGARGSQDAQIIVTLGISLILQNLVLLVWSGLPRAIRATYTVAAWELGDLVINFARTFAFLAAVGLAGALFLFLGRTTLGRAMRAAADDWEASLYMGVNVRRMYGIAFGLGIALTGAAGALISSYYPLDPFVGTRFIVLMFAAVVLGGMGSLSGAFLGGMTIGLVQQVSQVIVPPDLQNVAVFVVFLLVLYLRPSGLLGRKVRAI